MSTELYFTQKKRGAFVILKIKQFDSNRLNAEARVTLSISLFYQIDAGRVNESLHQ